MHATGLCNLATESWLESWTLKTSSMSLQARRRNAVLLMNQTKQGLAIVTWHGFDARLHGMMPRIFQKTNKQTFNLM